MNEFEVIAVSCCPLSNYEPFVFLCPRLHQVRSYQGSKVHMFTRGCGKVIYQLLLQGPTSDPNHHLIEHDHHLTCFVDFYRATSPLQFPQVFALYFLCD